MAASQCACVGSEKRVALVSLLINDCAAAPKAREGQHRSPRMRFGLVNQPNLKYPGDDGGFAQWRKSGGPAPFPMVELSNKFGDEPKVHWK